MRLASLMISISKINDNMVEVGQKGPCKWVEIFEFDAMRKKSRVKEYKEGDVVTRTLGWGIHWVTL